MKAGCCSSESNSQSRATQDIFGEEPAVAGVLFPFTRGFVFLPPPPFFEVDERFSSRFFWACFMTEGWSVWRYLPTLGPRVRANTQEIPPPSSRIVEELESVLVVVKRRLVGEQSQVATAGVIFQRTAPVVPPVRLEFRREGDWWMVRCCDEIVRVRVLAVGSRKPRFEEEGLEVKRVKDSVVVVWLITCIYM